MHAYTYVLGGKTCMTGDIIGEYSSFERPLAVGDRIVFGDMMQYSFVKNTTFNGTPLPGHRHAGRGRQLSRPAHVRLRGFPRPARLDHDRFRHSGRLYRVLQDAALRSSPATGAA